MDKLHVFTNNFWRDSTRYHIFVALNSRRQRWSQGEYEGAPAGPINAFLSLAEYATDSGRTQKNAVSASAFWLDLDCGAHKAYACQADIFDNLRHLVDAYAFPQPLTVNSGGGVHAYWVLEEPLGASIWHTTAKLLKQVCTARGIQADPSRTADISSLMRVPGTTNQKEGRQPRQTGVLYDPLLRTPVANFDEALKNAVEIVDVAAKSLTQDQKAKLELIHAAAMADIYPQRQYSAEQIAKECPQLESVRVKRGAVSEPLWYHTLQVIQFTQNALETAHAWSSGHPEYSPEATERKLEQLAPMGPSLCSTLNSAGVPGLCRGCRHFGKIKTPLELGWLTEATPEIAERREQEYGVEISLPTGFTIAVGGEIVFKDRSGLTIEIAPYTIFVSDYVKHVETNETLYNIKYRTPAGETHDMLVGGSMMADTKNTLLEMLWANGFAAPKLDAKSFQAYMQASATHAQATKPGVMLYRQYGWNEERSQFYIGHQSVGATESHNARRVGGSGATRLDRLDSTNPKGSIDAWMPVFHHYLAAPLAYRLGFFAGLAAPLLWMTGHAAITYSLCSPESGVGKTTVLRGVCGIWGDPRELLLMSQDSANSIMHKAALHHNLPLCIDEFSQVSGEAVGTFLYVMSGGREKGRLTRTIESAQQSYWETIGIVSTNSSLLSKIEVGSNMDGMRARVIELPLRWYTDKSTLREINVLSDENAGCMGQIWAKHIVAHRDDIQKKIIAAMAQIDTKAPWGDIGRLWSAFIATTSVSMQEAGALLGVRVDVTPTILEFMDVMGGSRQHLDRYAGTEGLPERTAEEMSREERNKTQRTQTFVNRALELAGGNTAIESAVPGASPYMNGHHAQAVYCENGGVVILESLLNKVGLYLDDFERCTILSTGIVGDVDKLGPKARRIPKDISLKIVINKEQKSESQTKHTHRAWPSRRHAT